MFGEEQKGINNFRGMNVGIPFVGPEAIKII
jgi:hypothetical protein